MEKKNAKQATSLQMVEIDHNKFAVELMNGNASVNLTQMSKPFGRSKRPEVWLRTQESADYIDAVSVALKSATADILTVKQGGTNQGTWAHDYRIAMRFAQWLSPQFSIEVDELLIKLLTKQSIVAEPINGVWPLIQNGTVGYPRKEIYVSAGYSSNCGNVGRMVKLYGRDHFFDIYRTACVSHKMARLIAKRGEVRQLEFDFSNSAAL
jgi:hypothetical protein